MNVTGWANQKHAQAPNRVHTLPSQPVQALLYERREHFLFFFFTQVISLLSSLRSLLFLSTLPILSYLLLPFLLFLIFFSFTSPRRSISNRLCTFSLCTTYPQPTSLPPYSNPPLPLLTPVIMPGNVKSTLPDQFVHLHLSLSSHPNPFSFLILKKTLTTFFS